MSYTNIEIVRNHIEYLQPISNFVSNQKVLVDTDSYIKVFSGSIQENSVNVKTINQTKPSRNKFNFISESHSFHATPIVRGTVLCASDSSLGTIYTENIDYIIDYTNAKCQIKAGGQLSVGMSVTIFFIPYTLYSENSDYRFNFENGEIQRVASGEMQLGETVYLDYIPEYNHYTAEILKNAVLESNAIIENQVDSEKQFGADIVLQTAATYRALEILCRSSAMRELMSNKKNDNANSWIKLADLYLQRSEKLVLTFKPPMNQIQKPTHS